ncbi:uncharacterized protein LOC129594366 isoform X1 [Paramacrobiotus metropolitanus]|uniref:uncharacterized protein LOC129594366 isoform X1 n=1 Tax=Paramacrobiotus metropolitanus TaxID=2943436 RepID=UPI002445DA5D|nr:uncharacterized protein LOC129594366 isoform X1 [Paramacrobiotus metropolitanus]XP_055347008.1 uncharacterized protein LOC129594366 isoform X1 [Paramacrobiotus metropolitanus]
MRTSVSNSYMEDVFWTVALNFSSLVDIHCKTRYCLILILLYKGLYSQLCAACGPVPPTNEGDLDRLVRKAEDEVQNGAIILPAFQWPRSHKNEMKNVIRTLTGMTATFACPTNMLTDTVWRHQNRTIAADNEETSKTRTFFYTRKDRGEFSYFFIHNVTYSALGGVQCLHRFNGSEDLFLIKHFELLPKLHSAEEVFPTVMLNVTSKQARNVSVTCTANVDCRCTKGPHLLFKFDRLFAVGPRDLTSGRVRPSRLRRRPPDVSKYEAFHNCRDMPERDTAPCSATLFLILSAHPQHRSVPVECWAQPDGNSDEWFVQKARVKFS